MIKKESDGYHIYSEKGKHLGGPYSKGKAEKRLQQIEMFKHMKESTMANGYIAFYSGKQVEVHADTSYAAQTKATAEFQKMFPRKKVKSYDVTVKLAEKDGKQVTTHSESLEEAKAKDCKQCGIKLSKLSKEEGFCVECATPINEAKDASQGKWTAKKGKNTNTFDVYLNGKYQYNIGAETSERAITLAKQQYKEIYKNPTVMDSNIAQCLTILEGGIPNSTGIRDALDKVITGDADLTDRERLTLLKYKLIGDNGKPTALAKEQFSELFD